MKTTLLLQSVIDSNESLWDKIFEILLTLFFWGIIIFLIILIFKYSKKAIKWIASSDKNRLITFKLGLITIVISIILTVIAYPYCLFGGLNGNWVILGITSFAVGSLVSILTYGKSKN